MDSTSRAAVIVNMSTGRVPQVEIDLGATLSTEWFADPLSVQP